MNGCSRDGYDRMDHKVHRQAVSIDFHRHRVDEKRHVVVDDFDDRVRRLPAMLFDCRIEDAHPRVSRRTLACEIPVRQRRAVEIGGTPFQQILRINLTVIALDETLQCRALLRRDARCNELRHFLQAAYTKIFGRVVHSILLAGGCVLPLQICL